MQISISAHYLISTLPNCPNESLLLRAMQLIGKITSIHGLKGEVSFSHHLKKSTKFNQWDCLMIELNPGSFIPFFIEAIRSTTNEECIVKLEEINNRDEAKVILNKHIYSSMNYTIDVLATFNLQQFVGFTVFDGEEEIGEIIDAVESKMNNMFVVNYNGKEVLLPSQQSLIVSTDMKERKIMMHLPEGLLDL